jgi:hypothetical protein
VDAELYPSDHPRCGEPPAPQAIPEFVMGQLEDAANLERLTDPRIRLLVEILIRTGLRIGDATRLALDCQVRNPQGAVYLRYRNHKMRRDAVVPIDDELTTMIEAQQTRIRQRFPTTKVLLPRGRANPDGRLPIPTATFFRQLCPSPHDQQFDDPAPGLLSNPFQDLQAPALNSQPAEGLLELTTGIRPAARPITPTRRYRLIAATVLRDTRSPSARRSARIRGAPYTPSEALWNTATLASTSARRAVVGLGPDSRALRHL